jgi:DNA-binding transcriptional ArsR family regulator
MSMATDLDDRPTTTALLRALAEPLRWRIVELLAAEELCVCHLVEELDAPQPLVSHHLRVLRDLGLVSTERYRYWTYYRLEPSALAPLAARLEALLREAPEPASRRRPCC